MATKIFRGDAVAVAQISTATPANVGVGDIFTLTINGKAVSFTATVATVANVTAGLVAAWNASTVAEHAEVTASDQTTYVKLLADTAGKPFTVTGSTTDGNASNTQTLTVATTTASAGPYDWSTASNWSSSGVPANGDTVIIDGTATSDLLYGLDQSAVTLASLIISQAYTGKIGLPLKNTGGYREYRPHYLAISSTLVTIGTGTSGGGSGRIKLDTGTAAVTGNVQNTGQPSDSGLEAFLWKGVNASNQWNVAKGSMGVAVLAGEVSTLPTLRVGYVSNAASDASVRCGSGVTLTTVNQIGGSFTFSSDLTTLNQTGGTSASTGDGVDISTLNLDGGTHYYQSNSTISTATIGPAAKLDYSRDMRASVLTVCTMAPGAGLDDPFNRLGTHDVILLQAGIGDMQKLNLGTDITLTVTPN